MIILLYVPVLLYLCYYALKNPRRKLFETKKPGSIQAKTEKQKKQDNKKSKDERKIELLRMQSKQLKIQRARVLEKYKSLEAEYIDAGQKRRQAIIKEFEKLDNTIYKIDFQRAKLYNEYLNITGAA